MIIAIHKLSYDWVDKHKEYNCAQCFVGTSKSTIRRAIEQDGEDYKDYVFFTDKTRAK